MIALDTNVLVRYLVEDDAEQTERAASLIDAASERQEPLFVAQIVVCETVWVLGSAYGFDRETIGHTLGEVLRARQLEVEDSDTLRRALDAFSVGPGDFADYLIRERARLAGCDRIATFDRALLGEPGFIEP